MGRVTPILVFVIIQQLTTISASYAEVSGGVWIHKEWDRYPYYLCDKVSWDCIWALSEGVTEDSKIPIPTENFSNFTRCRWSNEGCEEDLQCCSSSCIRVHEGTNPRCTKSKMKEPCFFDYQCNEGLECGTKYHCCAPYWAICMTISDCCDSEHVCREEDGFFYSRCLYISSAKNIHIGGNKLTIFTIVASVLNLIRLNTLP